MKLGIIVVCPANIMLARKNKSIHRWPKHCLRPIAYAAMAQINIVPGVEIAATNIEFLKALPNLPARHART
jgi:hypothetical protein